MSVRQTPAAPIYDEIERGNNMGLGSLVELQILVVLNDAHNPHLPVYSDLSFVRTKCGSFLDLSTLDMLDAVLSILSGRTKVQLSFSDKSQLRRSLAATAT